MDYVLTWFDSLTGQYLFKKKGGTTTDEQEAAKFPTREAAREAFPLHIGCCLPLQYALETREELIEEWQELQILRGRLNRAAAGRETAEDADALQTVYNNPAKDPRNRVARRAT